MLSDEKSYRLMVSYHCREVMCYNIEKLLHYRTSMNWYHTLAHSCSFWYCTIDYYNCEMYNHVLAYHWNAILVFNFITLLDINIYLYIEDEIGQKWVFFQYDSFLIKHIKFVIYNSCNDKCFDQSSIYGMLSDEKSYRLMVSHHCREV